MKKFMWIFLIGCGGTAGVAGSASGDVITTVIPPSVSLTPPTEQNTGTPETSDNGNPSEEIPEGSPAADSGVPDKDASAEEDECDRHNGHKAHKNRKHRHCKSHQKVEHDEYWDENE